MVVLYQVLAECRLTIRGIVVLYVDTHRLIVAEAAVVVVYGIQPIQPIVVEAAVVVAYGIQPIVVEAAVVVAYGIQPIVAEAAVAVWFLAEWRVSDFFGCLVIFRKYSIFAEEFIKNLFNDKNK